MYLFVGEKRSNKAVKMNVTWIDGRLAAKQLFDALINLGINPKDHSYCNYFERGGKSIVKKHNGKIIAMGSKVSRALMRDKIEHIKIIHPAARGTIRLKKNYFNHIKQKLS